MALRILILAGCAILLVAFIVEVAVPFVQGRRLFPSFRKNPLADKLAERLEEVETLEEAVEVTEDLADVTIHESRLQRELREAEEELAQARKPKQEPTEQPKQ